MDTPCLWYENHPVATALAMPGCQVGTAVDLAVLALLLCLPEPEALLVSPPAMLPNTLSAAAAASATNRSSLLASRSGSRARALAGASTPQTRRAVKQRMTAEKKGGGIQHCEGSSGPHRCFFYPRGQPRCADYRGTRGSAGRARERARIAWEGVQNGGSFDMHYSGRKRESNIVREVAGPIGVFFIPGGSPRCADYRGARGSAGGARERARTRVGCLVLLYVCSGSVTKIANLRLGISGLVLIGQNEPGCYDPHCAWGQ